MASKVTFGFLDYDSEKSSFSVEGVDLTAANLVAQLALIAALQAATVAITIGTNSDETVLLSREVISSTPPANPFAQRETKWLVTYSDDVTGDIHQAEIPTADLSNLTTNGGFLDTSPGSQGEDFVTAFESFVRGEGVNAVTVTNVRHIGRNL